MSLAVLPLVIVLGAGDASAQGQTDTPKSPSLSDIHRLDEVVVTATRRTETVMDVPFSVNVQEESDIQRLNTFSLEGLSRNVAGLSIQNLGPGQSVVNIRGISSGQIVRDQPGVKEQVGIYLDDTPIAISLFTPDLDLYDVQRVETLRGPQGTLFGSGSIGGTVRYVTNKPQLGVKEVRTQFDLNTIDSGVGRRARQSRLQRAVGRQRGRARDELRDQIRRVHRRPAGNGRNGQQRQRRRPLRRARVRVVETHRER